MIVPFLVTGAQNTLWFIFTLIDVWCYIPYLMYKFIAQGPNCSERKRVVVVGGNFSGLAAVRALQEHSRHLEVIVLDQREYFEYTPGILRLFREPHLLRVLTRPLSMTAPNVRLGMVTRIDEEKRQIAYRDPTSRSNDGAASSLSLAYDYLILATGSTYNYPITASSTETTIQERHNGWQRAARQVKAASSVLILGGGAVGTELAAELVEDGKTITLVDAAPRLVSIFPPSVSDYALQWLTKHGVTVRANVQLESWDHQSCTIAGTGEVIKADIVFVCFGDKPNSACLVPVQSSNINPRLKAPPGESSPTSVTAQRPIQFNRRQCVQTDANLRVSGTIFACGDVAAPPTQDIKQAYHAEVQGDVAGHNVVQLSQGKSMLQYPQDVALGCSILPMVYVLSLGKWDGVIGFNKVTVPGPLAAVLKWVIEWTKVRQMLQRPSGLLIWKIGDAVTFWISKHLLPPAE